LVGQRTAGRKMTQLPGFLTATGYDCSPVKHKMKRMTVDPSQSGCGSPSKGCCAPAAAHTEAGVTAPADTAVRECPPEIRAEMVDLPGGTFLMGTDHEFGLPADGEGPVHAVNLRPFAIDKFPVTNRRSASSSGQPAIAPRRNTSAGHSSSGRTSPLRSAPRSSKTPSPPLPGGARSVERSGMHPKAPAPHSTAAITIPPFTSPGTTRRPSLVGLADACPQRRNGNTRPAAVWCRNSIRGATSFVRTANIAATSGRASFRATIRRKMAILAPVPWTRSLPTERLWPIFHDRQYLGMVCGLVLARIASAVWRGQP
jgi:hypothetical protein